MIAIALSTIQETYRRRFVVAALIGTLVIAALSFWGFSSLHHLTRSGHPIGDVQVKSVAAVLVTFVAFLFSFILAFAAAMLAATMLTAEVESGVLLPVLARPVSRAAVVGGKALGLGIVLSAYAALAGFVEFAVVDATTGYVPPHPAAAVAGLCGVALTMLALTLALGSRLSLLASGLVSLLAFGVAWIAGVVASFGPAFGNVTLIRTGVVSQLFLPSDALWRTAVYQLEPAVIVAQLQSSGNVPPPFWAAAPPPPSMLIWSAFWIAGVLAIAMAGFTKRDV